MGQLSLQCIPDYGLSPSGYEEIHCPLPQSFDYTSLREDENEVFRNANEYSTQSCLGCNELDSDYMIKCDQPIHGEVHGWYHYSCFGLTEHSLADQWSCPGCRPRCEFDRLQAGQQSAAMVE